MPSYTFNDPKAPYAAPFHDVMVGTLGGDPAQWMINFAGENPEYMRFDYPEGVNLNDLLALWDTYAPQLLDAANLSALTVTADGVATIDLGCSYLYAYTGAQALEIIAPDGQIINTSFIVNTGAGNTLLSTEQVGIHTLRLITPFGNTTLTFEGV